jgi:small subunit ribosomal protein S17
MRNDRKVRQGLVVSDKMDKSIVVKVDEIKPHKLYKKIMTYSKKYHVHDEKNEAKAGDEVVIMETRPISKTKRWRLVSVKNAAQGEKA